MKALHADPKEIRKVFSEKYIIPDFQRPYSWEIDQCDKLWEDLEDFYNDKESKDDKYFLGNIVIHEERGAFVVIDGQQRLTTLLLLIKALHQRAGIVVALEECLKTKDPLTSALTNELKVQSHVIEDDFKYLKDIVFNNGINTPDSHKLKINYKHLEDKLSLWWQKTSSSTEALNNFILTLLDQVVLLPILCGSEDDSLIIFETINNRGMSLNDSDIFKAKLHRNADQKRDQFMKRWNKLSNHEWLFRVNMHIVRAKENEFGKEVALRTFFTKKDRLKEWELVTSNLEFIQYIENEWQAPVDINILWHILYTYPNYYWNFPLFVFLNKHGKFENGEIRIEEKRLIEFNLLITEIIKFFYIKGLVYNSVNAVKDTVFKVCTSIEKEEDYINEFRKSYINDIPEFQRRLATQHLGRYQKGLVLLCAYLNPNQNKDDFNKTLTSGNFHLEHILPKKWNHYDQWTDQTWTDHIDQIGNLVPLEWKLNISARNEFFDRKKIQYENSLVQDAKDLVALSNWFPADFSQRNATSLDRLINFFAVQEEVEA